MILTVLLQRSQWEENGQEMSHNGTIFPPQSVRRLGQKIIKWEDILYIYFTKCAKKID